MDPDSSTKIILTVINSFNILLTGILILTYMTSRKLQHHPSGIIISIAFCELATSYHSSIMMWGSDSVIKFLTIDKMEIWKFVGLSKHVTLVTCGVNIITFSFGEVTGILYNIILCLDLILSLRNPFATACKRMKFYHLAVIFTSLGLSGYISASFIKCACVDKGTKCFEISGHDSPNYKSRMNFIHKQEDIMLPLTEVFVSLAIFSIIYAGYRLKFGLKTSNSAFKASFIRHIMYVSVNILILGYLVCSLYIIDSNSDTSNYFENTSSYVISLGGVVLAAIRCTNPNFRVKLFSGKFLEIDEDTDNDNEWDSNLAQLSDELTAEVASSIYDSLFLVYSQKQKDGVENNVLSKSIKTHIRDAKQSRLAQALNIEADDIQSSISEYFPKLFDSIIRDSGIEFEVIAESMDPLKNFKSIAEASESKGKSGSFFLMTHNQDFVIKTVKESEINAIKNMIHNYAAHLKANKNSFLCKIFGAFLLNFPGITPIYIIVMENVIKDINPTIIYDLKGSTLGRQTEIKYEGLNESPSLGPFKDLDFIRSRKRIRCGNLQEIAMTLYSDTNLLKNSNVMDYSLLLCIEDRKEIGEFKVTYKIIDYLTSYGLLKKLERAFTVFMNPNKGNEVSVIDSNSYASRFTSFMLNRVFKDY